MRYVLCAVAGFVVGNFCGLFRWDVQIFHNINEHTWMNHGQLSIEVNLPEPIDWDSEFGDRAVINPHFEQSGNTVVVKSFDIEEKLQRPKK